MSAGTYSHPHPETLKSYGLGMLDRTVAESVTEHLESCVECRSRVAELSSDSFLDRLRSAKVPTNNSTAAWTKPSESRVDRGAGVANAPVSIDAMPPGLADHPDYEVLKELGRGGMGVVYLAHNRLMGRNEVLKVMGRHIMERPGLMSRFLAEIRAVARLQHPNIVTAYTAFRLGESIVFAMEYVEGLDLARMVKAKGPLPVVNACYFVNQAALGMQHAHEQGMVHRDIKPGNLMLSYKGDRAVVKVLDFGLAKATREEPVDGGLTNPGQALGTPDYMAPEQIRDAQKADIRADIYSLGCTLYYLLSGGPPFRASSLWDLYNAHHSMEAKRLNFIRPDVPVELAAIVAKMMAKEPERRFQMPRDVAQALAPFLKKGNTKFQEQRPDVSELGQPQARAKKKAEIASGRTQPATDLVPAAPPPPAPRKTQPEPAGPAWESLIEFKETEPLREPALASRKGVAENPRWLWPAAAGGLLLVMLALVAAVFVRSNGGPNTVDNDHPAPVEAPVAEPDEITAPAALTRPAAIEVARVADSSQFSVLSGDWREDGDALVQENATRSFSTIRFGDPGWVDYTFSVDVMRVGHGSSFALLFRGTEPGDQFEYAFAEAAQLRSLDRGQSRLVKRYDFSLHESTWYTARVYVRGPHLVCSIYDNANATETRVFDFVDASHPKGGVGLQTFGSGFRFKNIKVVSPGGKELWHGPPAVGRGSTAVARRPVLQAQSPVDARSGFVQMFDGKTLEGWKTHPAQPGRWRVNDGVLIGSGPGISHLYTIRDDYEDFHLRLEARVNNVANSGVYFRAPFGPTFPANNPQWLAAYNAKIDKNRFGGLIVDGAVGRPVIRDRVPTFQAGQWIALEIIVQGSHIEIKINGEKTADYTDQERNYSRGHIALQQHGQQTVVEFRKIEVKELKDERADAFQPGTVWTGKLVLFGAGARKDSDASATLTVRERQGERFRARYMLGKNIFEVNGSVSAGRIWWEARNVRAITGFQGPDPLDYAYIGTVKNQRISTTISGVDTRNGRRITGTLDVGLEN